jgi:4-hydroxy-tetrahydrodipicolinate synthase
MFEGVHTALVTPFRDGRPDIDGLERLVEFQIDGGVDGIVPCGTTGESATVNDAERAEIIAACVRFARGRVKVIGGVGTNDTAQSVRNAKAALECGADGGLVITPYYNKPTQEGLYAHCRHIAEQVPGLPLIVYNVPGRTSVSFTVDTLVRLADLPGVVAVKEATGNMVFDSEIVSRCGDRLTVLSGDDPTSLPLWSIGGRGVVSVSSNLVPARMVALWKAFDAGDLGEARRLHLQLLPLFTGLFMETNPVPVKTAVAWHTGALDPNVRLPLTSLLPETEPKLAELCRSLEISLPHRPQ